MGSNANSKALSRLVALVSDGYPVAALQAKIKNPRLEIIAAAGAHSTVVGLLASLRADQRLSAVNLVIVSTGREGEDVASSLKAQDPEAEVLEFVSWETLPHERLSPSPETVGKRLRVLHRLHEIVVAGGALDHAVYVVASVRAVLQPVVAGLGDFPPLTLVRGRDYLLPELTLKLVELAYQRVDLVTKRGEFAVRGGILDIFPTTAEHAVRLEFFGDELDDVREFSVTDQRSLSGQLDSTKIYAAREVIITPAVANKARQMVHEFPNLSTMLAKLAEGIPVDGMESLAPVLADRLVPFTEYLPADAGVVLLQPERRPPAQPAWLRPTKSFCMPRGMPQSRVRRHRSTSARADSSISAPSSRDSAGDSSQPSRSSAPMRPTSSTSICSRFRALPAATAAPSTGSSTRSAATS
ncbi:MAG: hypothetical protein RLZZ626_1192 [Actinomycetota bacterium]